MENDKDILNTAEIPYEVRMKYIIEAYRKDKERWAKLEAYAKRLEAYVSDRLKKAAWGDGVVRMLAEYIHTKSPKAKGWSYRTIYRMVRFYDTYSSESFLQTVNHYGMQHYLAETKQKKLPSQDGKIVSFEMAQIDNGEIVSFEMTQIPNGNVRDLVPDTHG